VYQSSNIGCYRQLENNDSVALSVAELADLRAVVQASRAAQSFDAHSLGITQERLDIEAPAAISAVVMVLQLGRNGATTRR
jgi:hypothetical protein